MTRRIPMALACGTAAAVLVWGFAELPAQQPGDKLKGFQKKGLLKGQPKADPKAPAADDDKPIPQDQLAFFEKKIRPVLVDQCYSCHTPETAKGAKGGLALDTRAGLRKGGDTGHAVVPNDLKASLILKAMKGDGLSQMPPKEKLSADVVADFEKWIAMGAPDPRTGKAGYSAKAIDIEKGREHWAFKPVRIEQFQNWKSEIENPIDGFVQKKREEHHLMPSPEADKRTLVRRAYFDLIGLPPTPGQVEAFVADTDPKAFEKLVDQLLASPQYGEKWGRHWLDVARYAESSGKEQNIVYPFAWRYRDYVIASFNADKPYDVFLTEQLAGDLMPAKDDAQKAERLTATGFLAIGPKSHNERNPRQFALDVADEQIDAMSQAMLGLTVACARCHDHKFDPIPTKDYYALAGIFTSTETKFGTAQSVQSRNTAPLVELPATAEAGQPLSKSELDRMKERVAELKKLQAEALKEVGKDAVAGGIRLIALNAQIATQEKQLSYYAADGTPKRMAMGAGDKPFPKDMPVLARGELTKPGEIVPRGFVQVVSTAPAKIAPRGSGRLELAGWVASETNPLTARVMANRVWLHLFGQGIVPTPDNFGTTGQAPTHPELLDYLAARFVKGGWSVKALVRDVMLSKTYRQASTFHAANAATDPDNTYLWRMSKRRLDAEAIRDSILAVSGELDAKPAAGSPLQKVEGPTQQVARFGGMGNLADTRKRSVYVPILRDQVPEALELFDAAEPNLVTGARESTSVPSQALYLMNNPQVMKLAESFAARIDRKSGSEAEKVTEAFKLAFSRPVTDAETKAATAFVERFIRTEARSGRRRGDVERAAWAAFAQALFSAAEFRYLD